MLCFRCNNAGADFQEYPQLLHQTVGYLSSDDPPAVEQVARARSRVRSLVASGP